ncbi:MAG: hypothetical protein D8M54_04530 [Chloroflexi bacterium]|nr:hypothetical protein [Chloroflexota bacterium]
MGETLSSAEQPVYQAGLLQLEQEEKDPLSANLLKQLLPLRQRIDELNTQHHQLVLENGKLDKKIKKLEKAYQTLTGYQLLK